MKHSVLCIISWIKHDIFFALVLLKETIFGLPCDGLLPGPAWSCCICAVLGWLVCSSVIGQTSEGQLWTVILLSMLVTPVS